MLLTELVAKVNAKSFGETEYTYDDIYPYFQEAIDSINSEISEHRHIGDAPYARASDPLFSRLAYTSLSDLHISNYIVTYIVVAMDNAQLAVTSRTQTYAAQLNNFKKQLKSDLYRFMPLTADSNNYLDLQPNSRRPRQLPNVTAWYDEQIGGLLPVDSDLPTLGVICDNPYGTLVPYDMNEHLRLGLNTYKYVFIPRPYFLQWYDKCIIPVKITGYDTQSASVSTVVGYTLDLGFFSNKNALYLAAYNVLTNRNNNISVDTTDASDTPKEAISKVTGTVGSYTQPNGSDYFSLSNATSYEITLINDSLLAHVINYTSGSTYYTETKELITISGNQAITTIINRDTITVGTINSGTFNLPGAELTGGEHYTTLYADYPDSGVNSIILGVDSADHGIEIRYGYNNGNLVDNITLTSDGGTQLLLNGKTGMLTFYPDSNVSEYKIDYDGFTFKNEDGDTLSWVDGTLDLDDSKITGLAAPTGNTDATNKKYVDDLIAALQDGKVNVSDVIDALNSTETTKPLSAKQGKALKDALDTLYSYVGFATEDDVDTTINKLREVFAFLTGALDNQTIIDLLNEKQNVIDSSNKLDADLMNDTNSTHKFVSASEKAQITNNENAISGILDGTTIDSFADVEGAIDAITLSADNTSVEINSKVISVKDSYVEGFFATSQEIDSMLEEVFG